MSEFFYSNDLPKLREDNITAVIEHLSIAGDNASALYGTAEAADHYTRALVLAKKLPQESQSETVATLFGKRGAANMALSRFDQSVEDYRSMLKHREVIDSPEKSPNRTSD